MGPGRGHLNSDSIVRNGSFALMSVNFCSNLIHFVNIPFTAVSTCTTVKVTGVFEDLGSKDIEVYFESAKSGGRKGSIKKCVIEENGVVFIEFDSPEGNIALV